MGKTFGLLLCFYLRIPLQSRFASSPTFLKSNRISDDRCYYSPESFNSSFNNVPSSPPTLIKTTFITPVKTSFSLASKKLFKAPLKTQLEYS